MIEVKYKEVASNYNRYKSENKQLREEEQRLKETVRKQREEITELIGVKDTLKVQKKSLKRENRKVRGM